MAECKEIVKIFRGGKKRFTIDIEEDKDPKDLSGATEIVVCIPSETGAPQQMTLTGTEVAILNATLGKIEVNAPAAKTALMKVAEEQTIEVRVTEGAADPEILQIEEAVTVIDSLK